MQIRPQIKVQSNFPPLHHFNVFKHTTFIDFFIQNNLDLPPVFNNSKSLMRLNTLNWFLKYNTLLMRKGFKTKLIHLSSFNVFWQNFQYDSNIPMNDAPIPPVQNKITISKILFTINPLFDFFIYKTPKLIWKYSRGRAGRFFVVWKFIPPFKRPNRILRWIVSNFKFENFQIRNSHTHSNMEKILSTLLIRKRFSHNYIFREGKFSIMKNFKPLK